MTFLLTDSFLVLEWKRFNIKCFKQEDDSHVFIAGTLKFDGVFLEQTDGLACYFSKSMSYRFQGPVHAHAFTLFYLPVKQNYIAIYIYILSDSHYYFILFFLCIHFSQGFPIFPILREKWPPLSEDLVH